jgi:hypothetical protein
LIPFPVEDEEGADRVENALKQKETLLPWTVLMEMYYITLQLEKLPEVVCFRLEDFLAFMRFIRDYLKTEYQYYGFDLSS